jgi:hypothetical protein
MDMDLVVIFVGIFTTIVGFNLSRAIARRMERKALDRDDLAEIRRHFEHLEQSVDAIAVEVERVSEGQRFTAKLLSGKPSVLDAPAQREPEKH